MLPKKNVLKELPSLHAQVRGSLGCNDCEMVEFRVLGVKSKITTLELRRADFGLF